MFSFVVILAVLFILFFLLYRFLREEIQKEREELELMSKYIREEKNESQDD